MVVVLMAEDEEMVRRFIARVLDEKGYECLRQSTPSRHWRSAKGMQTASSHY